MSGGSTQGIASSVPSRAPILPLAGAAAVFPSPVPVTDAPLDPQYFKTFEEIQAWPGYTKDVDPKNKKVARLIGLYNGLKIAVPCGLTCCHTAHKTGVVIETEDGVVTNIGHICGLRYLEEYQKVRNRYEMNVARSRQLRALRDLQNSEPIVRARIANLKAQPHTGDWLQNAWRNFINSVPSGVINELRDRARRNETRVVRMERLHGEEAERKRKFQVATSAGRSKDDPVYEEHELGHLRGLGIWKDKTIRDVLFDGVAGRLDRLATTDIPSLRTGELRNWAEWAESIDGLLDEAATLIREGREFFKQENLDLVARLWNDNTGNAVRNLKWDYETGTAKNPAPREPRRWRA